MINDEELPNVEPGQFSSPPDQKSPPSSSCLSWGLTLGGGLVFLIGCVTAFGATSIQFERQGDWEGFLAFIFLCPTPLMVMGIIVLTVGALPLVRKRQIEDA
ncbi:MAG: hypothetical protein L0287_25175 [Anaerolineae bacterium]|nr:hypothetical protein [Anaerolineae bacterium]MCI0609018.1 hypothetical protein [Anaerolineae bacterium]